MPVSGIGNREEASHDRLRHSPAQHLSDQERYGAYFSRGSAEIFSKYSGKLWAVDADLRPARAISATGTVLIEFLSDADAFDAQFNSQASILAQPNYLHAVSTGSISCQ